VLTVYNYFRDYDPQTGRYIESDPIGLQGRGRGGGYSTYAYVRGNPISYVDPQGLLGSEVSEARALGLLTPRNLPPATKARICAFLGSDYAHYNPQLAWKLSNDYRQANGWNNLLNRESENWLSILGWPGYDAPQSYLLSIYLHETILKVPGYLLKDTTPISLEALDVALSGYEREGASRDDLKKFCNSCQQ
jgi:RHS repeat-associated protein